MNGSWRVLVAMALCACGEPTVVLMAAGQDLEEGAVLEPSQLIQVKVSKVLATPNAVRPDAVAPLIGKRSRVALRKGDLVLASYFDEDPALSALVQKRARAVTLSVSGAENLHSGDHVDLLAVLRDPQTNEWVTTTEAQNVIVLTPGTLEPLTGTEAFPLRRVTFLLLSEEAELALLTVRIGALHVTLRNPEDLDVLDERGRATANTVLNGERKRVLEAKRSRVLAEGTPALTPPHPLEAPVPADTAPVPALPGRQGP